MVYYFLFITLKNILSFACFFILKAFEDILQHFKFVNGGFVFFDVTKGLVVEETILQVWNYVGLHMGL